MTEEQVQKLADAMWQILDDMGKDGQSSCLFAKAQARIAYEPWFRAEKLGDEKHQDGTPLFADWMSLEEAEAIIADIY